MSVVLLLVLLTALALFSFFFSASETAVIGLSKLRLRNMVKQGIKRAPSVQRLVNNLDRFIAAILIGNDFVNIAISAIITAIFVHLLGYHWGVAAATVISSLFVLIACEITPKILSTKHTEKVALITSPIMEFFLVLFHPLILFFTFSCNLILRLFRVGPTKRSPLITEEEIRLMIEVGKEEGVLSDEERKMLHRIFEFGDTRLAEVMIPKEKMVAVDVRTTSDDLLDIFAERGHARLPVYEGSVENIVGIAYARDLLYILRDKGLFVLQDILHVPYFVPATMRVNELLRRFQTDKIQIAIVVDAQKKVLGLATLEDLIEEIVGEIEEDKHNHHNHQ
ncbi:MAG: hemolysin family protein [Candidatus Omnitrophica bacterium]|nr:hemolysin family protein [Candidatus Omnitrophota bacterium]